MERLVLAVDFGTSNVHVNAVNCENGDIPFSTAEKYSIICPKDGYMELNPEEMWKKSESGVKYIVEQIRNSGKSYELQALTFSFFGDNIIPVDRQGTPVCNLMQCFDIRGKDQANNINQKLGPEYLIKITGDMSEYTSCSSKIKYLLEERRDITQKTEKYYNIQQFVLRKLGLPDVNDITMACTKRMVDLKHSQWFSSLLETVGISEYQLGKIVPSTEIIGQIEFYGEVRFPNKVKVIPGAHDCDCGWLGVGVSGSKEDTVGNITGTFEHFGFLAKGYYNIFSEHPDWNLFSYRGPLLDTSVILTAFDTSGALLEWFMREICGSTSKESYEKLWNMAQFQAENPVKVCPDFGCSKGKIEGLNLGHSKLDIFEALIEALTFESRIMVENCQKAKKTEIKKIRMGGGQARASQWVQLRADVTGKCYECMEQNEVSSIGAAILAAVGAGIYENVDSAIEKMVQIGNTYIPDPERGRKYEELYQSYKQIYRENERKIV